MKNIKLFLLFILVFFSFGFTYTYGGNLVSSSSNNSIPYCQDNDCGIEQGIVQLKNIQDIETDRKASVYIQDVVVNVLGYLYLIAVILIIYAGFLILTSSGDEEKTKKGKNIIIFTIIGIVIIYLASPIVEFIIGKILN